MANEFMCPDCMSACLTEGHAPDCVQLTGEWLKSRSCMGDKVREQAGLMEFVPILTETDEDVCEYRFHGQGRLVLTTIHGKICIDVRANDVNAFVILQPFGRRDSLIIPSFRP